MVRVTRPAVNDAALIPVSLNSETSEFASKALTSLSAETFRASLKRSPPVSTDAVSSGAGSGAGSSDKPVSITSPSLSRRTANCALAAASGKADKKGSSSRALLASDLPDITASMLKALGPPSTALAASACSSAKLVSRKGRPCSISLSKKSRSKGRTSCKSSGVAESGSVSIGYPDTGPASAGSPPSSVMVI